MKHLKRFNESLTDNEVEELKDFCESSLVYLLDDGYDVYIQREWNVGFHVLFGLPNDNFLWNDVKDYYIPFLQLLSRRYKLGNYGHGHGHDSEVYFQGPVECVPVERVINDELPSSYSLWGISVKVISKI